MTIQEKYEQLKQYLQNLNGVAIAFSGGVDSTFLLAAARDVLGDRAIAVTAKSCLFPKRELDEAARFCEANGIRHIVIEIDVFSIDGFAQNPLDRCYLCKRGLLADMRRAARDRGIDQMAEGSNTDDDGDYRPGFAAVKELGVLSPLRDAMLCKADIRELSKSMGLKTWDKQSFACLASRFPYGENITQERLMMIDRAEQLLLDAGFRQMRVRYHGNIARVETDGAGFKLFEDRGLREKIYREFQKIGFAYTALDLFGYRTGSMNP